MTITREPDSYVGRFAPSPTGPLHFGSLVAAVASYLQARANCGRWLLRIEDIDPPREQSGASEQIIERSGTIRIRMGRRRSLSKAPAIRSTLRPCTTLSAKTSPIAAIAQGAIWRTRQEVLWGSSTRVPVAMAASLAMQPSACEPTIPNRVRRWLQGRISQHLQSESGDFVIRRRDGLIAYHLAVVVDDEIEGHQ